MYTVSREFVQCLMYLLVLLYEYASSNSSVF